MGFPPRAFLSGFQGCGEGLLKLGGQGPGIYVWGLEPAALTAVRTPNSSAFLGTSWL